MAIYCPYCTKEIKTDDIQCSSCGAIYGLETLLLIRGLVKEAVKEFPAEHRKYDRVPKKFKIVYPNPNSLMKYYLFNIGQGGVFIRTKEPLKRREKFNLKIFLPDGGKEVEVFCEVSWSRKEERLTSKGRYPQGMGVKFLNLLPENKERIIGILRSSRT